MKRIRLSLSTTQVILLSFVAAIFIGSALLMLPISSVKGVTVSYIDALFTATTATCVTGLVTLSTASVWSPFGQAVILVLIQIGGLGVITVMSGFMLLLNKKLGIGDRLLVQDAFNLNSMSGLARFIKKVLLGTFIIEGVGALLYMTVFIPRFGARGIWISIFNSVSAFCNAGMDVFSENSLCDYATHPLINGVTSALIILGGLGYIVWWDVISVFKSRTQKNKRIFKLLSLHSKMALTSTAVLLLSGALLFLIFEYNNPNTIGELSLFDKLQVAAFQSVTTRTAGFVSVPQEDLTGASAALSVILMVIGGSPVGTAGGMKTVTVAVLLCSALTTVRNKSSATMFGRSIAEGSIRKAIAVAVTFMTICSISTVALMATNNVSAIDAVYETVSATATVGLSRSLTPSLNLVGKLIIIATMYLGRVGPISLAIALGSNNENKNVISEPAEDISIG